MKHLPSPCSRHPGPANRCPEPHESAAKQTQIWVVSHATRLIAALEQQPECHALGLEKELGETKLVGPGMLDAPSWRWLGR